MNKQIRWPLLIGGSALLSACAVGPNYHAPPKEEAVPEGWHATLPHGGELSALTQWWRQFDDPMLAELVDLAEARQPTIAAAVAAVREARASVTSSRSGLFPQVGANGVMTRSSGSGDQGGSDTSPYTLFNGSLDASWEIDLFGGTRRGLEASQARLQAAQANWNDARVSLAAEVANAYTERRHCERLVALYRDTLQSRRETERLTSLKLKAGFVASADEAQARAGTYESENLLIAQQGLCQQDLNRLAQLTAMPAAELEARLNAAESNGTTHGARHGDIPVPTQPVVPSLPAALLSQRPDVMSAERSLAAASANVGVAVASRLPSLSLGGAIGINHLAHTDNNVRSWSFSPQISLPIFEGGAGVARVETARAQYDQALAQYRSKVLVAVQEVEDALTRVDASVRRVEAARQAAENYAVLLASQENRYQLGAASLLDLEDSRRLALASQQALANVELEISQAWIALYKAAGGGWNDEASGTAAVQETKGGNDAAPQTPAGAGA